nr:AAA family ATPase [bacterium]
VNENFKEIIKQLFEGGEAELNLIDESDALESGIEINVRPPGKKVQNIMLLSGGEKAMAAIGLLFALFKVKPSPFCILDEIDAPLDDANISRFLKLLRDFSQNSQFVIITHHKKTMATCDVLYGITMEEKGVSKVLSVKITDNKKIEELAG